MKISRWLLILLPCLPLLGLLAPVTALPEPFDPWFLRFTTLLFLLSFLYYFPASGLAHAIWFFVPDLSIPLYIRCLLYPACVLQSLLLSFLVWRRFQPRSRSTP